MSFGEYSRHWLSRQLKYSQGTRESYRRILEKVYPYIGDIEIAKLCPLALENMLADEEAQLLLTEFCNLPLTYETYYVLAVFTGCRRGELCALKWSDVTIYDNYDWATINIYRSRSSVPGKGVVGESTKSG